MKSSLRKLRGFALHGGHHHRGSAGDHHGGGGGKERRAHADQDELAQASRDMQDMRDCYDSLLSAAAATANSAYEFSEALRELGSCLLEKTALNDDEESGRVLLMLGKAQFELQKLVDSYRIHIIQTITTPSESLLKELQTVEEMKQQCDDKRDLYKFILAAQREKGRPTRNVKGERFSLCALQEAQEAYDEEATLFVFRLKSLKQGQSRSLLTQAARHHAAQLHFFRRGVKSLEVIEPHVKVVAEQQHIDYHFTGLEDDDTEDDEDYSFDGNEDGELSFDYGQNDQDQDAARSMRNSMELDQVNLASAPTSTTGTQQENVVRNQADFISFSMGHRVDSQSAPLFADRLESSERIKTLRPSSTRKFHTYVLPTPVAAKSSNLTGLGKPASAGRLDLKGGEHTQMWHSSPLDPKKYSKDFSYDEPSSPVRLSKAQSVLKESNINSGPIRMPPPLAEGLSLSTPYLVSDAKKIKRQAFSGPLTRNSWSSRPILSTTTSLLSVEHHPVVSRVLARNSTRQPSASPRVSPTASPPLMSSPKISELHELPRPPKSLAGPTKPSSLFGHSAPLISRSQEFYSTNWRPSVTSYTASPLPTPPGPMARSYSIPSSGQRTPMLTVAKLLEAPRNSESAAGVASPPLTPLSLKNIRKGSSSSDSVSELQ